MNLKDFIEDISKQKGPMNAIGLATKLIELEGITQYLNLMYGVELDIKVLPAPKLEGRYYGTGLIEKLS